MADWRQIQARIRKAKTSSDPPAQLAELYERTRDAMVAFELAQWHEKSGNPVETVQWYTTAAQRFRRAQWRTKAVEALTRLGAPIPEPSPLGAAEHAAATGGPEAADLAQAAHVFSREAPAASHQESSMEHETNQMHAGDGMESRSSETAEENGAAAAPNTAAGAAAGKRRRRGRRGGRKRRGRGGAGQPAGAVGAGAGRGPAEASRGSFAATGSGSAYAGERASTREPAEHLSDVGVGEVSSEPQFAREPDAAFEEQPRTSRPFETSPGARATAWQGSSPGLVSSRSRAGDPGLSSRIAQLESQLRRLLACPLSSLDEADQAPAGPGVLLLSDSDQVTHYYVEACQTLRIGVGSLMRGGRGSKGASQLKPGLAEHLGISDSRVAKYLKDHCAVRWIQLDEGAAELAHFATAVLRPVVSE